MHSALGLCWMHYIRQHRHGHTGKLKADAGSGCLVKGYVIVGSERALQHVAIAERALGHPLPPKAIVHHINECRSDNRNENLVICPNHEYHMLIHQRMRALAACGHADWRPCSFCSQHDDPAQMRPMRRQFYHLSCKRDYYRRKRMAA